MTGFEPRISLSEATALPTVPHALFVDCFECLNMRRRHFIILGIKVNIIGITGIAYEWHTYNNLYLNNITLKILHNSVGKLVKVTWPRFFMSKYLPRGWWWWWYSVNKYSLSVSRTLSDPNWCVKNLSNLKWTSQVWS